MAKLAVIILNWNGLEMLKEYFPSVAEHTVGADVQLIVADNGSDDGSVAWLRERWPEVRLMEFERNYGYAEGYNRAIARTDAEYVLLLNSDVRVGEGWWQPLLEFMETHKDAGALQPKILSAREPEKFEYAGAAGGLLDKLGYPYCRGRVLDDIEADCGQYDDMAAEVAWASGAALLARKSAYEQVGGLDPLFFAHMEEIDLCWRMQAAGFKIYAVPFSKVWHYGGGSLSYGNPRKTYLNFRNNLLLLHKNMPRQAGRNLLFRRRLVDTLAFGLFLVKGQLADARAVIKAHVDFRKMKRQYDDLPEVNIMEQLPGTNCYIFLRHYLHRNKKKK